MTRTTLLRLTTLQLRHIRFTDALTFIGLLQNNHNKLGILLPLKLAFFINESYCCAIK